MVVVVVVYVVPRCSLQSEAVVHLENVRLRPRITKIDTYIHYDELNSNTGYDVTDSSRLEVIEVQKTVENAATDGYWWNLSKTVLREDHQISHGCRDDWPYKSVGYDITRYFR